MSFCVCRQVLGPPARFKYVAATAIPLFVTPIGAQAGVSFDTRVLSGDTAPGTNANFSGFATSLPKINNAGQIVFTGLVTGDGVDPSNDSGVWSGAKGSLRLVAREGDQAPGTADGINFNRFIPGLNAAGQTVFAGYLAGDSVDSSNDHGIWSEAAGSLGNPALLVRTGDNTPGNSNGATYRSFNFPVFNADGEIAFLGFLATSTSRDASIWSEAAGSIGTPTLIAREDSLAPGLFGVDFSNLRNPVLNDSGQTAFYSSLSGLNVDSSSNGSIWSEAAGSVGTPGLVAREGDHAPGTPDGVTFSVLGDPVINATGQVAFLSFVRDFSPDSEVNNSNNSGIWAETIGGSGNLRLVVRKGNQAFDTPNGVVFGTLDSPVINAAGQTAFIASLTGTGIDASNDLGIWSEATGGDGELKLVAREGDHAPGTPNNVNFHDFEEPTLNAVGQAAFLAELSGTNVDSTNDRGIWVTEPNGQLNLVIREGDSFDIDDDPGNEELRIIDVIRTGLTIFNGETGNEDGRASSFNDQGQLVINLSFTDGSSGIFVANTLAPILPGDYNSDGFVSQADLDLVLLNWGDTVLPDGFDADAIADGDPFDGLISQNELDGVLLNWGDGNPPNLNAIPEPAAASLLVLMGGLLRPRRRA